MKSTHVKLFIGTLALFFIAAPAFATIMNSDQCQQGVCVKVYEHRSVEPSDAMAYGRRDGDIFFVYRFNGAEDQIILFFSKILPETCDGIQNTPRVGVNDAIAEGCIDLNGKQSRTFRVHVISKITRPAQLVSFTNPTIWIKCDQASFECDSKTSAPYQIKVLLRH